MCPYRITLYCPDTHLTYDIRTLDERGVGGGVTSRIRTAHALAARGHTVTAFVNCPEESVIAGVEYRHFTRLNSGHVIPSGDTAPLARSAVRRAARNLPFCSPDDLPLETDIFIATTSGGGYDLSSLRGICVEAKLRILMAHGAAPPHGWNCFPFDFVYAPSNFIRAVAAARWGVPDEKIFVCPRGVVGEFFARPPPGRDPFALAYAAHPSKGLDAAIAVLRLLRAEEPCFTLHVYGGEGLWAVETSRRGVSTETIEPGVIRHGLLGQRQLARELMACGFSLNLESLEESFGLAVAESMRAGCIVLASPAGAYPEIIRHGVNGFLIEGAHTDASTQWRAADLILNLIRRPGRLGAMRNNAMATPLDWDEVAQRWEAHWRSAM